MNNAISPRFLALGLNPAWQKTLRFKDLVRNRVNRAYRADAVASGKGINFATALHRLGFRGTVVQFAGGHTGQELCADLDRRGIAHLTVWCDVLTRTCTTLLADADRSMTELIEPAGSVSGHNVHALRTLLQEHLADTNALAVCGTYPPGVPASFYADIVTAARDAGAMVLLDAYKDVTAAYHAGPHIVKINATELRAVMSEPDLLRAGSRFLHAYPVRLLGVTDGAEAAHLFTRRCAWSFALPELNSVISPLGAGDTANAALLGRLVQASCRADGHLHDPAQALDEQTDDLPDIFAAALATASASCLTDTPALFDPAQAEALQAKIRVTCVKTF